MLVRDRLSVGDAFVEVRGGELRVGDRYREQVLVVGEGARVEVVPTHPINVPTRVATHIMVDVHPPVVVEGEGSFWVSVPYELEVRVGDLAVAYLSPTKVKFAVFGEVTGGLLCRYSRSRAFEGPVHEVGKAPMLVRYESERTALVDIVVVPAYTPIYVRGEGEYYYAAVKGKVSQGVIVAVPAGPPPVEGVREVRGVRVAARIMRMFREVFSE